MNALDLDSAGLEVITAYATYRRYPTCVPFGGTVARLGTATDVPVSMSREAIPASPERSSRVRSLLTVLPILENFLIWASPWDRERQNRRETD